MNTKQTVKEFLDSTVNLSEVTVITAKLGGSTTYQCDNVESLPEAVLNANLVDYELDFDSDEGAVYLDLICE